ncbi:MAG: hypothetical protein IKN53_01415 [Oscillibacter sp.]|nr:hypothetical protein [Oscillibacter sp.]
MYKEIYTSEEFARVPASPPAAEAFCSTHEFTPPMKVQCGGRRRKKLLASLLAAALLGGAVLGAGALSAQSAGGAEASEELTEQIAERPVEGEEETV